MQANPIKVIPLAEYKALAELFEEAVAHLAYCSYGDSYERECARDDNLAPRLESMLKRVEKILELNK